MMIFNDKTAARELDVAVQTLRNWRFQRKGPAYLKIGRNIRYQWEDIEKYKRKNRVDPEK